MTPREKLDRELSQLLPKAAGYAVVLITPEDPEKKEVEAGDPVVLAIRTTHAENMVQILSEGLDLAQQGTWAAKQDKRPVTQQDLRKRCGSVGDGGVILPGDPRWFRP